MTLSSLYIKGRLNNILSHLVEYWRPLERYKTFWGTLSDLSDIMRLLEARSNDCEVSWVIFKVTWVALKITSVKFKVAYIEGEGHLNQVQGHFNDS